MVLFVGDLRVLVIVVNLIGNIFNIFFKLLRAKKYFLILSIEKFSLFREVFKCFGNNFFSDFNFFGFFLKILRLFRDEIFSLFNIRLIKYSGKSISAIRELKWSNKVISFNNGFLNNILLRMNNLFIEFKYLS
jgi:hypothetical protein